MSAFHWSAAHVAAIDPANGSAAPPIRRRECAAIVPGLDLWDHWPVQEEDGRTAEIAGGALVLFLSAPAAPDPDARHSHARIRLMHRGQGGWRDLGPLLPDGFSPGSREWAGSAVIDAAHRRLTLYYTATGTRGEASESFGQRLVETTASILIDGDTVALTDWTTPVDSVRPDGAIYMRDMSGGAAIGTIKAFRDPFYFRDPATGVEHLLFAASLAASASPWNGAVGLATRGPGEAWALQPPLAHADGVNNEMERPHLVLHDGRYHLFWSTQRRTFAARGPSGPNGLYGAVADSLSGPWRPLNGTGLVLANPASAPFQAYSWQVLADLSVWSFVDLAELDRVPTDPAEARAHFGGHPAPVLQLRIQGDAARLA